MQTYPAIADHQTCDDSGLATYVLRWTLSQARGLGTRLRGHHKKCVRQDGSLTASGLRSKVPSRVSCGYGTTGLHHDAGKWNGQ